MGIELVRIDDRLVHGQIVMAWCKAVPVERIVVIDEEAAQDILRKMLLETTAPPGIKVIVLPVSQGIEYLKKAALTGEKLLLLTAGPATVLTLAENDIHFNTVTIGGMSFGQDKIRVTQSVSISDIDRQAFKELHKRGIALQIQILPHDAPVDFMAVLSG